MVIKMRKNKLRTMKKENKCIINSWLTIPNAWTAELIAHLGYDASTIDMQHGLADFETTVAMLQSISTSTSVPIVRVPWNDPILLMRILDAGAYGIICPMINNAKEAEALVTTCKYPPEGYRSYGPIRANLYGGKEYFQNANDETVVFAMIETADGLENLEEIAATPGLGGLYVGTIDLSIALGLTESPLGSLEEQVLIDALIEISQTAKKYNLISGIHSYSLEETKRLVNLEYNMITPTIDTYDLQKISKNILDEVRNYTKEHS